MVKPALIYADVIRLLREHTSLPVAAYHVSGQRTQQGQESFDQDHTMAVFGLRWGP